MAKLFYITSPALDDGIQRQRFVLARSISESHGSISKTGRLSRYRRSLPCHATVSHHSHLGIKWGRLFLEIVRKTVSQNPRRLSEHDGNLSMLYKIYLRKSASLPLRWPLYWQRSRTVHKFCPSQKRQSSDTKHSYPVIDTWDRHNKSQELNFGVTVKKVESKLCWSH